MNYHCYTVFEGGRCPVCGSDRVREVKEDDECLLRQAGALEAGMLCEVLQQEGIPCYRQSQIGAAMAVLIGRQQEMFNVLVPFRCLQQARETADGLFAGDGEIQEEGILYSDEDYEGTFEEEDDGDGQ
ncbi:MAG: hypothetical protein GX637_01815 [Clostridiales bacterium]|nr:hypothetical protein [Clostridiales bacterium]